MEYYNSVFKKKEILSFMIWMKLKDIMLNEIIQAQKDKYSMTCFGWNVEQSNL